MISSDSEGQRRAIRNNGSTLCLGKALESLSFKHLEVDLVPTQSLYPYHLVSFVP